MAQVVGQDFKLEGIAPSTPRAAKHAIDKLPPQLTKGGFNLLSHLTEDKAVRRSLSASNQQHQGNRQHFGITKSWLGVRRVSPLSQRGMGFQEVAHGTIDFRHLGFYATMH